MSSLPGICEISREGQSRSDVIVTFGNNKVGLNSFPAEAYITGDDTKYATVILTNLQDANDIESNDQGQSQIILQSSTAEGFDALIHYLEIAKLSLE